MTFLGLSFSVRRRRPQVAAYHILVVHRGALDYRLEYEIMSFGRAHHFEFLFGALASPVDFDFQFLEPVDSLNNRARNANRGRTAFGL